MRETSVSEPGSGVVPMTTTVSRPGPSESATAERAAEHKAKAQAACNAGDRKLAIEPPIYNVHPQEARQSAQSGRSRPVSASRRNREFFPECRMVSLSSP